MIKQVQALFIFVLTIFYPLQAQDTTSVSLVFVGDVMGHDTQINNAYDEPQGLTFMMNALNTLAIYLPTQILQLQTSKLL